MLQKNAGIFYEDAMVFALNDKRISELPNNLLCFVERLFGHLDKDEIIKCRKTVDYVKPDIQITYKGLTMNVSMKSGNSEAVHSESIDSLCAFLREEGISEKTIRTLRLYHFGDGTTDGSGKQRKDYFHVMSELGDDIQEANFELNSDINFVIKAVERFFFVGVDVNAIQAHAIYHGTDDFGVVVLKKQLIRYVTQHLRQSLYNPHIGPMMIRPHARYVNKEVVSEKRRNTVEIYWPRLFQDLRMISERMSFYTTPFPYHN